MAFRILEVDCDHNGRPIPGTAYLCTREFRSREDGEDVARRIAAALDLAGCRPGVRRFEVVEA